MLSTPPSFQNSSFPIVLVYSILFALVSWIGCMLLGAVIWNIPVHISFARFLPTFELKQLYSNLLPAIQFSLATYFLISSSVAHFASWITRNTHSSVLLERKYAINFVVLITQSLLIVNFWSKSTFLVILVGVFVLNALLFLFSIKREKVRSIQ